MSLAQWKANGWLKTHVTDAQELSNLLLIADRDITDASAVEAAELLDFVKELRIDVVNRLKQKYPTLGS